MVHIIQMMHVVKFSFFVRPENENSVTVIVKCR